VAGGCGWAGADGIAGAHVVTAGCAGGLGTMVEAVAIFVGLTTIDVPPGAGGAAATAGRTAFAGGGGAAGWIAATGATMGVAEPGEAGVGDAWTRDVPWPVLAGGAAAGVVDSIATAANGGTSDFHGVTDARSIGAGEAGVTGGGDAASFVATDGAGATGVTACATPCTAWLFAKTGDMGGNPGTCDDLARTGRPIRLLAIGESCADVVVSTDSGWTAPAVANWLG
jgi:hypothetical protein